MKLLRALVSLVILSAVAVGLRAQTPQPRPYKVVFDLSSSDPIDQQIVDLADLPHLAGHNVRLAGVTAGGARVTPADIEFGPSGETSRAVESVVWLVAGAGDDVHYLPIHVSPVTGLATMGSYSASGPSSPSMAATASGP